LSVRLLVDSSLLASGTLTLRGDEHHYLSKVRRLAVDDTVTLFDGEGSQAQARIVAIDAEQSELLVDAPSAMPLPPFALTIAPALIKGERMDLAITKMVELGVRCIRPLTTERTIVRLKADRAQARHKRFESLALAAARQSQNPHPAKIEPIRPFSEVVAAADDYDLKLIPCLSQAVVPLEEALPSSETRSAMVLIGPEGGFSGDEVQLAEARGFVPVSLGPRTLRAETACIAVATILSFRYGDVGRR
jgi:16S rRNA (uracil1498-N3)-methyltransferase